MFLSTGYLHLGVGLGKGSEGIHKREEIECYIRICLFGLLGMGPESEEKLHQKVFYSVREETGGLDL